MSKEVQKWADSAMYRSADMPTTKPKVHLISMTPDPLGSLAIAAKVYKGEIVHSLAEITDDERRKFFDDLTKTTLNAAFETIDFHFMIEGVTRAFTHQLVRQRTAVYFQESMRFAVIDENLPSRTALPPSLKNTVSNEEFLWQCKADGVHPEDNMTMDQAKRGAWDAALKTVDDAYKSLVNNGMPAEDARGLLPTNVLTRIHYKTNLRNLVDVAGVRLCTQAQFEWRHVFSQIAVAIRHAKIVLPRAAQGDSYQEWFPVHMADLIADRLFRPVCYSTGKCEFMASFDRACSIRDRVQANHAAGRPSSEWHEATYPKAHPGHTVDPSGNPIIEAISPAEWMLDDGAARS